ncbi:expressed unknown protein [Ectocarpus siliculosus]|uniref:Ferredoxin thioredoxin reductase alpha chain domain-containing protein n=1 Tax=Ectocarpus siliculosus TaxID=2880 RepID=D7FQX7_ECTSI|nr:expressed unknown protein [Ectocarpus siliculosus]|eukprot:CBJ26131.1 expressed unknown protein [Ectocarpus siliculosus]
MILPASFVGATLVFFSSHAEAFITNGRAPLVQACYRLHGRAATPVPRAPRSRVLMVSNQDGVLMDEFGIPIYDENGEINDDQLDDYQKNPDGLKEGDPITVIAKGLTFYHVRGHKDGFDPEGCVGQISSLYIMSKKYEGEFSTAHRPVVCTFTHPKKFKAHLEFGEVRKATPEEIEKNQQLIDAQNALDAIEQAKRDAARAAKEAEEAAAKAAE